jgi:hypothetical protein
MASTGTIIVIVVIVVLALTILFVLINAVKIVKEKEVMIIERLGRYNRTLTAGVHFLVPLIEYPKKLSYRYYVTNARGQVQIVERKGITRISTQNEIIDFPAQRVITRDNASILLDAVLSYKIVNPKVGGPGMHGRWEWTVGVGGGSGQLSMQGGAVGRGRPPTRGTALVFFFFFFFFFWGGVCLAFFFFFFFFWFCFVFVINLSFEFKSNAPPHR